MNVHTHPSSDPWAPGGRAADAPIIRLASGVRFPPTPDEPVVEHAAHYAASHGWHVFPLRLGEKISHKSAARSGGRKWGQTTDVAEIRRDFQTWADANVGIACGAASEIFVVETDTADGHGDGVDGAAELAKLEAVHGMLPATLEAISPSGSVHRYYAHPGYKIKNSASEIGPGIDVRGDGGMVVAPPSIKPDKGVYSWRNDLAVADAPQWLLDRIVAGKQKPEPEQRAKPTVDEQSISERAKATIRPPVTPTFASMANRPWVEAVLRGEYNAVASAPRGTRNDQLNTSSVKFGHYVGGGVIDEQEAVDTMFDACLANGLLDETGRDACLATIDSGMSFGKTVPKGIPEFTQPPAEGQQGENTPTEDQPDPEVMPVDLWAKFSPPSLSPGILPHIIESYAFVQGSAMGSDISGFAIAAIVVCAAAIPDKIQIQPKKHNTGWKESARLWVALVGPPSTMKSPLISAVVYPLQRIDMEMSRANSEAQSRYNRLTAKEKRATDAPTQMRLMLQDTAIEAAQEVFKDSPDGLLSYQDELSGFFGSMDKYSGKSGASKDRAFWLQSYNGGSYSVQRIGRGSVHIPNLSACIIGGIQPDVIRLVAGDSVDDGLLQRLLPVILQPAVLGHDEPLSDEASYYAKLIRDLHDLRHGEPVTLKFDEAAQQIRHDLEVTHLELMKCESVNRKLSAHFGKYNGIFARLCVVFHCIEHASHGWRELPILVSAETAGRAKALLHGFLLPHAKAFYVNTLGLSDDHDQLTTVGGYILAHRLTRITNRTIQRGGRLMRRLKRAETEAIFEQLDALGWISADLSPRNGPKSTAWIVNPAVHTQFPDRARTEKERREDDKELLAGVFRK